MGSPTELSAAELKKRQAYSLWLSGRTLQSETDAVRFIKAVGLALRYNATPSLPLAAMYTAAGETRRAIEFTNSLLAACEAIETNVIADRLVLVHRSLAGPVFALRHRKRAASLSSTADRVLGLIQTDGHASAGDVRRFLGVQGTRRPDAADLALTELQRDLLVDRGPASIPKKGVPYLSPEGYPYRIFEKTHPDVVRAAAKLSVPVATSVLIEAYLQAAVFVTERKLASMFKLLFSDAEMKEAIDGLIAKKRLIKHGRVVCAAPPG